MNSSVLYQGCRRARQTHGYGNISLTLACRRHPLSKQKSPKNIAPLKMELVLAYPEPAVSG